MTAQKKEVQYSSLCRAFSKRSIVNLLSYYKFNFLEKEEVDLYNQYLDKFSNDPLFLNQYAWRMTELNVHLNNALQIENPTTTATSH